MKNRLLKSIAVLFSVFAVSTLNLAASEINQGIVKGNTIGYNTPTTDSKVSCYLSEGEELIIADETDYFYGVYIENNEVVYIEKTYLQVKNSEIKDDQVQSVEPIQEDKPIQEGKAVQDSIEQSGNPITKGDQVISYAKQFIGLNYRSGGANLKTGVDCSGFTQQIFLKFDVKLQRSSRDQYAVNGKKVTKEELIPGDLVFYGVGGRVRHVAIYIGDDQIIHAPVPGKSVCIVSMQQRGSDPIIGYKRIF